MVLHTINKAASSHSAFADCLQVCADSDALVLLEDGVYSAVAKTPSAEHLSERSKAGLRIYLIADDVEARGLSHRMESFAQLIDYERFVDLVVHHEVTQSWF